MEKRRAKKKISYRRILYVAEKNIVTSVDLKFFDLGKSGSPKILQKYLRGMALKISKGSLNLWAE